MPLYDYQCQECGNTFSQISSITSRYDPEMLPCCKCNGQVKMVIGIPSIIGGVSKPIPDWFNDRLKKIKKRYPSGSTNLDNNIKR